MPKPIRLQLNIRFSGEEKAELLQSLDDYLRQYKITKADFIARCIEVGIKQDLANDYPSMASFDSQDVLEQIQQAISPIVQQLQDLQQRLEKLEEGEIEEEDEIPEVGDMIKIYSHQWDEYNSRSY
ncbi:MAG: hypothetical protein AAFV71_14595 [Cyanobacteria bacterium J06633_8]